MVGGVIVELGCRVRVCDTGSESADERADDGDVENYAFDVRQAELDYRGSRRILVALATR